MLNWFRSHPRLVYALVAAMVGTAVIAMMLNSPAAVPRQAPTPTAFTPSNTQNSAPASTTTTSNQSPKASGQINLLLALKATKQETLSDPTGRIAKNVPGDPVQTVTATEALLINAKKQFDKCYVPDNPDIYICAKQLPPGVSLGRFNGELQEYQLTAQETANRTLVLASTRTGECHTIAEHRSTSCNEW